MSARLATGLALATVLLLAVPGAAEACAVCFQAKTDGSRIAFIATTAAMTALPLLLVGGVAWWVRKQFLDAADVAKAKAARQPAATSALRAH